MNPEINFKLYFYYFIPTIFQILLLILNLQLKNQINNNNNNNNNNIFLFFYVLNHKRSKSINFQ
jgi:hypothetical protein